MRKIKTLIGVEDGKAVMHNEFDQANALDLSQLLAQLEILKEDVIKLYKSQCIRDSG